MAVHITRVIGEAFLHQLQGHGPSPVHKQWRQQQSRQRLYHITHRFVSFFLCFYGALHPQKLYSLLGMGKGEGGGGGTCIAHPITLTHRHQRDRQPPTEKQCWGDGGQCKATSVVTAVSTAVLIAVLTAVQNKVTKTVSKKQLLRNNSAPSPSSWSPLDSWHLSPFLKCIDLIPTNTVTGPVVLLCFQFLFNIVPYWHFTVKCISTWKNRLKKLLKQWTPM